MEDQLSWVMLVLIGLWHLAMVNLGPQWEADRNRRPVILYQCWIHDAATGHNLAHLFFLSSLPQLLSGVQLWSISWTLLLQDAVFMERSNA